ncbi:MAG: 1-(5-phosphoribosyl)-5-[(5-phosphoribosylamino) methylideneamino]imidazole-4-carboxamide isomerase [Acidimicrobiia bacterium]|nr:MAG: 1-(5-phosphoribosyl)-5-[(5-phosphoribosylamino) methylideneamino]imidazole-4-carboxamide isomerase [Acidimicrobiia bacterium]
MNIIPAVDVLDGGVVRLLQGDFDRVTSYDPDPVAMAERWMDEGATIVHVVDLAAARSGTPGDDLWTDLAGAGVSFQIGGGIRDATTASRAIDAGAARVVIGSAIVSHPERLGEIVTAVGSEQVVAAVDVRAGKARGSGWEDDGVDLEVAIRRVQDAGVGALLVTGIETDGAMTGPDRSLLERVRGLIPEIDLIASGGVGSLSDVAMLSEMGCTGVIVGRALYENRFTLSDARVAGSVL